MQPKGSVAWKEIGGKEDSSFPDEYSVAGWFRFIKHTHTWNLVYRFTINGEPVNRDLGVLGDRTLALWTGTPANGILHFTTYSYHNLNNGAG